MLTAAHVWAAVERFDNIGFLLAGYFSNFAIQKDNIDVKLLPARTPREWGEWGPDLALIRLPSPAIGRIAAHKSFLTLTRQRENYRAAVDDTASRAWVVAGAVDEFSEREDDAEAQMVRVHVRSWSFLTMVQQRHLREGYDYLDFGVKPWLPGVPKSFKGVSGGGAWEIGLKKTASSGIVWDGSRRFRGVAFWEAATSGTTTMVRAHGPQSLFDRAWEAWKLPDATSGHIV